MTWILTASGKHFDYADPQPDQIDINDILVGLSNESRFAGQTNVFYSVAQHSVHVASLVDEEHTLEALLHDASEAYLKDIPSPLKALLPDYRATEAKVNAVIRDKFHLPAMLSPQVKQADFVMLATERRDLMPLDACDWKLPWPATNEILVRAWEPNIARLNFYVVYQNSRRI